ncbi:MAG: chemotaxis protein CheW [Robiginitomaculum sp.]|nr:MAG: chemotaxis protein CheW [Robiginitomaculum sp.]
MTETLHSDESELVAFVVGNQEYCVDIMKVREIRGWTPATALPDAPDYVQGVINLRGSVLPIVDLAKRLDMETTEPSERHVIIISQIRDQVVGLLVDSVSDILTVSNETIQPTPDVASEVAQSFVGGVLALEDGRMISLIALDRILPNFSTDTEVEVAA